MLNGTERHHVRHARAGAPGRSILTPISPRWKTSDLRRTGWRTQTTVSSESPDSYNLPYLRSRRNLAAKAATSIGIHLLHALLQYASIARASVIGIKTDHASLPTMVRYADQHAAPMASSGNIAWQTLYRDSAAIPLQMYAGKFIANSLPSCIH